MKKPIDLLYKGIGIRSFYRLLIMIIGAATFISCEDLLQENPKTVVAENFYNTAEEVQTATNAIYSPLRAERAEQIAILDTHTDWGYGRGSRAQYNDFTGFNAANINAATTRWNSFYEAIRNANLVIAHAPDGTAISEDDISRYVAEARFLRALSYFDLVRNWGEVPLRTEENYTLVDLRKSTLEEVYSLILQDLIYAETNLPADPSQPGRPTYFAAKTLLADVYLTLNRFEESRNKAEEVIGSNKFALVPVNSTEDFRRNLFGPDLNTSSEEIFYFKYARQVAQGNWLLWILNHPSTNLFNFGGAYAHYGDASNPFFTNWDENDLRKGFWDQVDFGMGPNTLVYGKYADPVAISNTGAGNDIPIYRYAEVLLLFAEASARAVGGPTVEGMEALNQVHRRAYGRNPSLPSEIDFNLDDYDEDLFMDLVLTERAYEFQFEGKRWLDLKRSGKAEAVIREAKGITISETHYLWPIPFEEINLNKALDPAFDQNPGY